MMKTPTLKDDWDDLRFMGKFAILVLTLPAIVVGGIIYAGLEEMKIIKSKK